MEEIATFRSFPHIGDKVFGYLTNPNDFKNCLFVCKSWSEILNKPPTFWLNKLKKLPQDVLIVLKREQDVPFEDWQNFIIKFKDIDLAQKELAIGLREEYFVRHKRANGKYWWTIPKKMTICKLCGSSYEFYKDHLRGLYHFYKGYELPKSNKIKSNVEFILHV